ncbi:hypothetical protein IWQ47_000591 [Aquimarina sp. EL_43]|uniref:hypothetical protein n=1 Tax=Aquimarina TaxID=290174 RepID=UPI00047171AE|nr:MULTISPECIES: hypothetical protein [Aquimarina]MBG6128718.1 hypothetical protein [Aquimarina sp. EL_35]MBG6149781.1 hypothetical protein [Aquimarina sp. EL_32]MBG6167533.1 hypothetical protein [Aquimarina sp. EL_43]
MLKTILDLEGTKSLKKSEQKGINGGRIPVLRKCCNPALRCCTTSHVALNNPSCGATYIPGCSYHPSNGCCI